MIKSNKSLTLAIALGLALASPAALANGFYVTAGVSHVNPDGDTDASSETAPSLGLGYAFDDSWSVELNGNIGSYEHTLSHVDLGGEYASLDGDMVDLSVIYRFQSDYNWRPYIGAGAVHTSFDNAKILGIDVDSLGVGVESDTSFMVRGGVDYNFQSGWFARADLSYGFVESEVYAEGIGSYKVDVHPLRTTVSVGYNF